MEKITLELQIEELNAILSLLGNQPYVQVYGLIEKIKGQAAGQISEAPVMEQGTGPEKDLEHA